MKTLIAAVVFFTACAHTQAEEMTAVEHRNEAAIHEAQAQKLRENAPSAPLAALPEWNARVYDPGLQNLDAADREMKAAAEHLKAARALEAFEDARCSAIPKAERAACPLLASSVQRVTETRAGILLELRPGVDAVATQLRLDCHLAYAQAQGFDRPSCPLFVKGMTIALVIGNGARWISMTSEDAAVAEQIREQARRIFRFEPRVSAR